MSIKKDLLKYIPRKEQTDALNFIKKIIKEKKDNKFFLMNLPVGVGKSHLALMLSDYYLTDINKGGKVDIITAGKFLQDQYSDTYESINDLRGKDNYQCDTYDCSCLQGKEFNKLNKTNCSECPYTAAKNDYMSGQVAMTNFHLYLIYAIYADDENSKMESRKANVLIVDESHELEDVMTSFISIKITDSLIKKLKLSNDDEMIRQLHNVGNITEYVNFLHILLDEMNTTIDDIEKSMGGGRSVISDKRDLKLSKLTGLPNSDMKLMSIVSDIKQHQSKIEVFLREYKDNENNWVLESNYNEKTRHKELSLEPIWASDYLDKYVWSKYDLVILMSGTILDKRLFSELNGIDVNKSVYYSIPSPFELKNRPIYYMPLGKMSYDKKSETFKSYIPFINKILSKYNDKKGIIHTNSFELSKWIEDSVKDPRLVFHDSTNKDIVLRNHFESDKSSVIVSPSVGTGISFDNERARFQVIAKIPYPSLASQKNKIRMKNNSEWMSYSTVCKLLQMTGRVIRNSNDYADTIIIDGSFSDIMKYSSHYLPQWVQESIKKVDVKV